MSWKKCPFGCVFQIDDSSWSIKTKSPTVVCPTCHRASAPAKFTVAAGGAATAIANRAMATSLMNGGKKVDELVKERMATLLTGLGMFESTRKKAIDNIYTRLVQLLMNAELNSNFVAKSIIALMDSGSMKNMWAFPVADNAKSKAYAQERDRGERQVFGALSQKLREGETPDAANRPVYITLNVGNLQQGGASMYGLSYFVYRDAVKLRCTFLATDSLQMIKQQNNLPEAKRTGVGTRDLATYSTLPNVLLRVSDNRLKFLCSQAGGPAANYNDEFIEAHGWGEINIAQDVKAIILSEVELQEFLDMGNSDTVPDSFKSLNATQRREALADLKTRLRDFCNQHSIELQFLNLDRMNTTRGLVGRPRLT